MSPTLWALVGLYTCSFGILRLSTSDFWSLQMTADASDKSFQHLVPRIQTLGTVSGRRLRLSSPFVLEMGVEELRGD